MPRTLALGTALALALAAPSAASAEAPLELRRVVLSTGGVGYFEHEAEVDGDASLTLDVRLDQVDDVLKSLVVLDSAGAVGPLSLPGRQPLDEAFRDLPFARAALDSPVDLLNALQGAVIEAAGPQPVRGRIVRVLPEPVRLDDGRTLTRHRVTVMAADGLRQFVLEDAEQVRFADPVLQAQVESALAVTARHRVPDRRELRLSTSGSGSRTVRVGYVVAAPLWKASYRISLPAAPDGETRLQGWAILENLSGTDWNDVDLTLLSGNPVTFRQSLYQAYRVERPEVPVEVMGRVLPPVDQGAAPAAEPSPMAAAAPQAFNARMRGITAKAAESGLADALAETQAAAAGLAGAAAATASEEATAQVRFHYGEPVSVEAGESLSVPLIDRPIPAEQLSVFRQGVAGRHPMASVRITNDGDSGLPPGVLTLYQRGGEGRLNYLGDARLSPLPAGDDRLLGYAVDGKTVVDVDEGRARRIDTGSIAEGLFRLRSVERLTTGYAVTAPAGEARSMLIEHPRRDGFRLVAPATGNPQATEGHYRLPLEVEAGATARLQVEMERPVEERYALVDLDAAQAQAWARAPALPAQVRQAFARMVELKRAVDERRQALADLERRRDAVAQDQQRIRDNLGRVPRESDLHRRYLEKLAEQETALDDVAGREDEAREAVRQAEAELARYIGSLTL